MPSGSPLLFCAPFTEHVDQARCHTWALRWGEAGNRTPQLGSQPGLKATSTSTLESLEGFEPSCFGLEDLARPAGRDIVWQPI